MKKIFLLIFVFALGIFLNWKILPGKAYALITIDGDLEVVYDSPLFGPEISWYPGVSANRNLTVRNNNGGSSHTTYIKAINTLENGNLSTVMYFLVREGGTDRYGAGDSKTMRNFWNDGEVSLSDIGPAKSTTYNINILFGHQAGNEFQEKQAKFDLAVGFKGTNNEVVVSGGTTGSTSDGGTTTTTTTTTTTATSPTPILGVTLPAVAGITTAPSAEVKGVTLPQNGQVKGAICPNNQLPWWLPLIIQTVLIFAYYFLIRKRKFAGWWVAPVILAAISQLIHQILGCECFDSFWCPRYWLLNLSILGLWGVFCAKDKRS